MSRECDECISYADLYCRRRAEWALQSLLVEQERPRKNDLLRASASLVAADTEFSELLLQHSELQLHLEPPAFLQRLRPLLQDTCTLAVLREACLTAHKHPERLRLGAKLKLIATVSSKLVALFERHFQRFEQCVALVLSITNRYLTKCEALWQSGWMRVQEALRVVAQTQVLMENTLLMHEAMEVRQWKHVASQHIDDVRAWWFGVVRYQQAVLLLLDYDHKSRQPLNNQSNLSALRSIHRRSLRYFKELSACQGVLRAPFVTAPEPDPREPELEQQEEEEEEEEEHEQKGDQEEKRAAPVLPAESKEEATPEQELEEEDSKTKRGAEKDLSEPAPCNWLEVLPRIQTAQEIVSNWIHEATRFHTKLVLGQVRQRVVVEVKRLRSEIGKQALVTREAKVSWKNEQQLEAQTLLHSCDQSITTKQAKICRNLQNAVEKTRTAYVKQLLLLRELQQKMLAATPLARAAKAALPRFESPEFLKGERKLSECWAQIQRKTLATRQRFREEMRQRRLMLLRERVRRFLKRHGILVRRRNALTARLWLDQNGKWDSQKPRLETLQRQISDQIGTILDRADTVADELHAMATSVHSASLSFEEYMQIHQRRLCYLFLTRYMALLKKWAPE